MQTFEIDGVRFAAGLVWQASDKAPDKMVLSEVALDFNATHYVVRNEKDSHFFGLCAPVEAKPGKLFSAAAIVSKSLSMEGVQSFLAAFPIGADQWLYVAQRDGVLLPQGDLLASEDKVRGLMLTEVLHGSYERVICPPNWKVPGDSFGELDFRSLVPATKGGKLSPKSWALIKPVAAKSPVVPIVAAVCVLGVAGFAAYSHWQKLENEKRLAQIAQQNAQQHLPPPWQEQPTALTFLDACMKNLAQVNPSVAGWSFEAARCEGSAMTATWRRVEKGTRQAMADAVPGAVISVDGDLATYQLELSGLAKIGSNFQTGELKVLASRLIDSLQAIGIQPVVAPAPDGAGSANFDITTWADPRVLAALPSMESNSVINSIEMKIEGSGLVWVYRGAIYNGVTQ